MELSSWLLPDSGRRRANMADSPQAKGSPMPQARGNPERSRRRAKPSTGAYQIKITLAGSKPPIWRRFVVPADIELTDLHDVIQIVMGWHGGHLHAFQIAG